MRQLPKFPWQLIMYSSAIVFSNLSFPITAKPIFRPYGEVVILASNFIAANRHTVFAIAASYYIHHVSIGYNLRVFVKPICPAQCITCRAAICYCCTLRACRALFTPFHDFALQIHFSRPKTLLQKQISIHTLLHYHQRLRFYSPTAPAKRIISPVPHHTAFTDTVLIHPLLTSCSTSLSQYPHLSPILSHNGTLCT